MTIVESFSHAGRTPIAAVEHLEARAQRVCDSLGNKGRPPAWTLGDVTAVRDLIRQIKAALDDETPGDA